MTFPYEEFDLSGVRTYPLKSRASKVRVDDFARPVAADATVGRLLDSLPDILAGADLKAVVQRAGRRQAQRRRHHLGPRRARHQDRARPDPDRPDGARLRVGDRDQRRRGDSRLRDRAGRRHVGGRRSSARARRVRDGGRNRPAAERGDQRRRRRRARHRAGRRTVSQRPPAAVRPQERPRGRRPPADSRSRSTSRSEPTSSTCTPPRRAPRSARAACAISATSSANVARLEQGVFVNCGSAVILPEVFLKAVALARNQRHHAGGPDDGQPRFRADVPAETNVVTRPTAGIGHGYSIVGHHEIMIPLLAAALIEADSRT